MEKLFGIALMLFVTAVAAWLWGGSVLPLFMMTAVFWALCRFMGGFARRD